MTVGDRAGRHVLHLPGLRRRRTRHGERDDAAAVDEQKPADRPSEQQIAATVVEHRVPVHRLGERQAAQRAAENVRQHIDRRLAPLLPAERQILALRRLDALERGDLHALLRGEASGRRRRRAVGLEAGGRRWSVHQLLEIGLPLGDAYDPNREAARRAERVDGRLRRQAVLAQLRGDDFADFVGEARQPARGQLLAADLQQELTIHGRLLPQPMRAGLRRRPWDRRTRALLRWPLLRR